MYLSVGKDENSTPLSAPDVGGHSNFFDSTLEDVLNHMKEMEMQIRILRGENHELKRAMRHLYTLAQITKKEIRDSSSKLNAKVDSLAEVLDNGCPCSVNLDSKITAVHFRARVVEAKIDSMREEIQKCALKQRDLGGLDGEQAENLSNPPPRQYMSNHQ